MAYRDQLLYIKQWGILDLITQNTTCLPFDKMHTSTWHRAVRQNVKVGHQCKGNSITSENITSLWSQSPRLHEGHLNLSLLNCPCRVYSHDFDRGIKMLVYVYFKLRTS